MQSAAPSITAYLDTLSPDRRADFELVLARMRESVPEGYEEAMGFGMVVWQVPLSTYPDTYNKKPLMYAALAWQKHHLGVYLCNVYALPGLRTRLEEAFSAAGTKLDMGASCIRVKRASDLPLDVIGELAAATPVHAYVAHAKATHAATKTGQKKAKKA